MRRLVDVGTRPLPPPGRTRYREEFARHLCERPRRYRLARACHLVLQALRATLAGPS
ncbi:hypothetical protein [Spirillospora sp. CA-294931]|uniref:hypothetical protein n=1 Tax=Spirillospora sp. CA-294931 TaxID=3240042 RepID=UPI003D930095